MRVGMRILTHELIGSGNWKMSYNEHGIGKGKKLAERPERAATRVRATCREHT